MTQLEHIRVIVIVPNLFYLHKIFLNEKKLLYNVNIFTFLYILGLKHLGLFTPQTIDRPLKTRPWRGKMIEV